MDDEGCVNDCTKCPKLVDSRSQIVNGVGPMDADLLIVGEAPGENEDENGEPFVGKSGNLLDEELNNNGMERKDVRITNTVRCRPKDNRDPRKSEIKNCFGYLESEISMVDPEVVLPVGRIPTQAILDDDASVTKIAGDVKNRLFDGVMVKVVPGIHPAATMYDPSYKELFEESIDKATSIVNEEND